MNEFDEKYKQQILFSEDEQATLDIADAPPEKQVIVSNVDWQPEESLADVDEPQIEEPSKPRWLLRVSLLLLTGVVAIEGYDFFINGFANAPIVTGLYAGLLGCVSILAGTSLIRELVGLKQLKKQQTVKTNATAILAGESTINAQQLCESITENLPCDIAQKDLKVWQDLDIDDYSDAEVLELYSRLVLSKVDEKAIAEVAKFSSESVVLIALSPVAILDMMIMLWRNLKMLDKIAGLYGLKLGYWSRIKLIRQVFVNMVYAGASELVTDFGADMLGADVLGKLSGRLAQGLGAGLLTARLGLKAIALCRPIPFDKRAPKLGQIRAKMIEQIKALTLKSK